MRNKQPQLVSISPKNDAAKKKLDYHGERWLLKDKLDVVKFTREPGPWLVLISRDGKKCIHVKQSGDLDFDVRVL